MIDIEKIETGRLERIKGGSSEAIWIGIAIATFTVFISGVIQGITNPERCNE